MFSRCISFFGSLAGLFLVVVPGFCNSVSTMSIEDTIFKDINQYRASYHLPPLKRVPVITQEARQHSIDMAVHRVPLGHTGFSTRVKHIYPHIIMPNGGAENFAYRYKDGHIVSNGWMHSPGHRQNILGHYNYTGIGVARDGAGRLYFTQIFIRGEGTK